MKKIFVFIMCFALIAGFTVLPAQASDYSTPNAALGKTAFASSQYGGPHTVGTINDGNLYSAWSFGGQILKGKSDGYEYVGVDLGQEYILEAVVARSRRDMDQPGSRVGWLIQASNDEDFSTYATLGVRSSEGAFGSDTEITDIDQETAYRYIRVASAGAIVIAELEVYGTPFDPTVIPDFTDVVGTKDEIPVNIVRELGFMKGTTRTVFGKNLALTRAEASEIVAKFANLNIAGEKGTIFQDVTEDMAEYEAIYACLNANIVSKDTAFNPKSYITVAEFMKMILASMGYMPQINVNGGWFGSVTLTAQNVGISFPKGKSSNDLLNRADAANIIYEALQSPIYRISSISNGDTMMEKQESYIEATFDKIIDEGIVTSNYYSTYYEPIEKGKSYICIDGVEYSDKNGKMAKMLGKSIVFITDDENNITAAWENKEDNEITTVLREDVTEVSKNTITVSVNDKSKKYRYNEETAILKNHVAWQGWKLEDFKGNLGKLELIDNDKDGNIDVINIYDPQIIIIEYSDYSDEELSIGAQNGNGVVFKDIKALNVYKDGEKNDVSNMAKNGVAVIYASVNKRIINIDYSFKVVNGRVSASDDDGCTVDGDRYEYSTYFIHYGIKPMLDENYTVIMNGDNEIMWMVKKIGLKDTESRGFIQKVYGDDAKNKTEFRIFDESGTFLTLTAADKITVDGKKYSNLGTFANANPSYFKYKFAVYKLDSDGKINFLDTENYDPKLEPNSNMIKSDVQASSGNIIFDEGIYSMNKMIMPVKTTINAFSIPMVNGEFVDDEVYDKLYDANVINKIFAYAGHLNAECDFYNVDEFGYPEFVVKKPSYAEMTESNSTAITNVYAPGMILDKISSSVDASGEECAVFSGYNISSGAYETVKVSSNITEFYDTYKMQQEHGSWFDGQYLFSVSNVGTGNLVPYTIPIMSAKRGDVMRYEIVDGEAVAVERVFDYGRGMIDSWDSTTKAFYSTGDHYAWPRADFRLIYGKILKVGDGKLQMTSANGLTETFLYTKVQHVMLCDGEKIKEKTVESLPMYTDDNMRILLYTCDRVNVTVVVYEY